MALTSTILGSAVPGGIRETRINLALDSSYPTGGYTLTPALFGYQQLSDVNVLCFSSIPIGCAEYVYNPVTFKLQLIVSAGTEVANGTSLAGTTLDVKGYDA